VQAMTMAAAARGLEFRHFWSDMSCFELGHRSSSRIGNYRSRDVGGTTI
jgi:hypothetical protein